MSKTKENFDAILKEKNIPHHYQETEDGNHLYRLVYRISEGHELIVEATLQGRVDEYTDAQLIYRHVHMLSDRSKEGDALDLLNELNGFRTGYYNLHLAGDGEIFLRTLMRTGPDARPFYETMVAGSAICKDVIPDLTKRLGESAPVR